MDDIKVKSSAASTNQTMPHLKTLLFVRRESIILWIETYTLSLQNVGGQADNAAFFFLAYWKFLADVHFVNLNERLCPWGFLLQF